MTSPLLLLVMVLVSPGAPTTDQQDLLNFLITQNDINRSKASAAIRYRYTDKFFHAPRDQDPYESDRRVEVYQAGAQRMVVENADAFAHHPDGSVTRERIENRSVIGEQYSARWAMGSPTAEQWDHASISTMSPETKERIRHATGSDLLNYGFGNGLMSLSDLYQNDSGGASWKVDEIVIDGEKAYEIRTHRPSGSVRSILTMEPAKGFMITHVRAFSRRGRTTTSIDVEVEESKGVWLATKIREQSYLDVDADRELVKFWDRTIVMDEVEINPHFTPERFTLKALGLAEGCRIAHFLIDGTQTVDTVAFGGIISNEFQQLVGTQPFDPEHLDVGPGSTPETASATEHALQSDWGAQARMTTAAVQPLHDHPMIARPVSVALIVISVVALSILALLAFRRWKATMQ
jgi:hypothetical protein